MKLRIPIIVIGSLALLLLVGLSQLLRIRFSLGDVYPPYSSLRSDPLGTRALHDALDESGEVNIGRFFRHLRHLPSGNDTVIILAGLRLEHLDAEPHEFEKLNEFLNQGGRLLLAMNAEAANDLRGKSSMPPGMGRTLTQTNQIHLANRWGFQIAENGSSGDAKNISLQQAKRATNVTGVSAERLPESIPWRSAVAFQNLESDWKVIFWKGTNAVVMVRSWGHGEIAALSDSFWLSNEALRNSRELGLIIWSLGNRKNVIFDETHLGTQDNPGVAAFARRYRLHVFTGVLLWLALLFVWKHSTSFVPPVPTRFSDSECVQGLDAASGFTALLRRSVPPQTLLSLCLKEWIKTGHGGRIVSKPRLHAVEEVIQRENQAQSNRASTLSLYREISGHLNSPISMVPTRAMSSKSNASTHD